MARIILINGPSGAGKSTTAKLILDRVEGEWAYIAQDDIRDLVKSGYSSANGMPKDWSEATKRQYAVSIPLCCDMIHRYQDAGINIVCDFFAEPGEFDEWVERLEGLQYDAYVLLPSLSSTLAQNQERTGTAKLTDEKVAFNHSLFARSTIPEATYIDSTDLSVDAVVDQILGVK